MKAVAVMAVTMVLVIAGLLTYTDVQTQKKDITICQLHNKIDHTKKKCE